jgi:hypothetical protein
MKSKIEAYKAVLAIVKEYSAVFEEDRIVPTEGTINTVLHSLEVQERFGIPLKDLAYGGSSYPVAKAHDEWTRIGLFGSESIGYSDDGRQPDNEWLFRIQFTTGAYSFGTYDANVYPKETFNAFFEELKTYNPKFCDTANHALYFTEETAKAVYDDFWPIFNHYKALVADEMKAKRKAELEEELAKLSGE